MNGKQKQFKRPPTRDGMDVDEFIRRNADPIWLQQNEMWEYDPVSGTGRVKLRKVCAARAFPNTLPEAMFTYRFLI